MDLLWIKTIFKLLVMLNRVFSDFSVTPVPIGLGFGFGIAFGLSLWKRWKRYGVVLEEVRSKPGTLKSWLCPGFLLCVSYTLQSSLKSRTSRCQLLIQSESNQSHFRGFLQINDSWPSNRFTRSWIFSYLFHNCCAFFPRLLSFTPIHPPDFNIKHQECLKILPIQSVHPMN